MAAKLKITYDGVGDILYLETVKPYAEQETMHLGPDVLGRMNPTSGAVENIEILFFTKRATKNNGLALPVSADLQLSERRVSRARKRPSNKGPRR